MKATPILFNGAMVRALLEGRKTQTRRVVKPQPKNSDGRHASSRHGFEFFGGEYPEHGSVVWCPYGRPGDLLWVRETFAFSRLYSLCAPRGVPCGSDTFYREGMSDKEWEALHTRTHPAIHMPRWASRLTLKIQDVSVERVQDIRAADVIAEGVDVHEAERRLKMIEPADFDVCAFAELWHSINGAREYSWDSNPWVWALTFEVINQNVIEVLRG